MRSAFPSSQARCMPSIATGMAVHTVGYRASTGVNYQGHHKTKNGCTQAIKIFCMQQFRLHLRRQSDDATVTRHPTHARRELLALAPEEHRESTLSYEWAILHQSSVWVSSVVNSTMIAALWSAYKLCSVCERDVRRYLLKTQVCGFDLWLQPLASSERAEVICDSHYGAQYS